MLDQAGLDRNLQNKLQHDTGAEQQLMCPSDVKCDEQKKSQGGTGISQKGHHHNLRHPEEEDHDDKQENEYGEPGNKKPGYSGVS